MPDVASARERRLAAFIAAGLVSAWGVESRGQLPMGCPFFPVAPIPVGAGPEAIASADIDNDGDNDLIVANRADNSLTILRNTGTAAFVADAETLTSLGQPVALAVDDLNGDTFPDIVAANSLLDTVSVFLNDGSGGFPPNPSSTHAVGPAPAAVSLARVDAGASLDIITANLNDGTVSVLLNNGDGTFGGASHFPAGGANDGPSALAADHAGNRLVVALRNADAISVLSENGAGGYNAPVVLPILPPGSRPVSIALANFNGDAFLDVATANAGTGTVAIMFGGAMPLFDPPAQVAVGGEPLAVAAGPIDSGGSPDIAVVSYADATATILFNNGAGAFGLTSSAVYATQAGPRGLVLVNLDEDTDLDLAVVNADAYSVSVLRNKPPPGPFASFVIYDSGVEPRSVAFGDLNGDMMPDLAVVNFASDDISIFINSGDGRYQEEERYTAGVDPRGVAIGDLDGDGRNDLVVANFQTDNISVLMNNGSNTPGARFAPQVTYPAGDGPAAVAVGELDGLNGPDVAVATMNAAGIRIFLNDGKGGLAEQTPIGEPRSYQDVKIALLRAPALRSGPTALDIIALDADMPRAEVFINDGGGHFGPAGTTAVGGNPRAVVARDFNGDNLVDAAVACFASGTVTVLQNQGGGMMNAVQDLAVAPGLSGIAAGRINNDASIDLVAVSDTNGTAHVLLNQGGGTFTLSLTLPVGMGAAAADLADLDGDDRDDLAVVNSLDNTAVVVVNLGFIPTVPPSFSQQPQFNPPGGPFDAGTNLDITIGAFGNAPLTYQWRRNGMPVVPDGMRVSLNPATGTLSFTPLIPADEGNYDVVVTDACGLSAGSGGVFLDIAGGVPPCCMGNADKITPGQVSFADITSVLINFGLPANPDGTSAGDADCNGTINFADITTVLIFFGMLCP